MNRQERKREGRGKNKFLTIVNEKTNKQERRIKERGRRKKKNEGKEGVSEWVSEWEANAIVYKLYDFFAVMIALVQ